MAEKNKSIKTYRKKLTNSGGAAITLSCFAFIFSSLGVFLEILATNLYNKIFTNKISDIAAKNVLGYLNEYDISVTALVMSLITLVSMLCAVKKKKIDGNFTTLLTFTSAAMLIRPIVRIIHWFSNDTFINNLKFGEDNLKFISIANLLIGFLPAIAFFLLMICGIVLFRNLSAENPFKLAREVIVDSDKYENSETDENVSEKSGLENTDSGSDKNLNSETADSKDEPNDIEDNKKVSLEKEPEIPKEGNTEKVTEEEFKESETLDNKKADDEILPEPEVLFDDTAVNKKEDVIEPQEIKASLDDDNNEEKYKPYNESENIKPKDNSGENINDQFNYFDNNADMNIQKEPVYNTVNSSENENKQQNYSYVKNIFGTPKKVCARCGAKLAEQAVFCPKCGNKL